MKIEVTVKTRICYWQGTALHEVYFEDFSGIIRNIDTPAPEIQLTKNINLIYPTPVIVDIVRDENSEELVLCIYPTPKD